MVSQPELAIKIIEFLEGGQPPFVACELIEANGTRHTFQETVPIARLENLDADSEYPVPGAIRCMVVDQWRATDGCELVRVSTWEPDHVESTDGRTEFVVVRSQVSRD